MSRLKEEVNMGLKKKYVTLWRPDGEPVSVNISDPVNAAEIIKGLKEKGCVEKKPGVTAEDKRAKEAEVKAEADEKADKAKKAEDAKLLADALKK